MTRLRDEQQSFNRIELDGDGITVTIQRWADGRFVSGDSQSFHRSGDQWRQESGAKVDRAEEAAD